MLSKLHAEDLVQNMAEFYYISLSRVLSDFDVCCFQFTLIEIPLYGSDIKFVYYF